MTQRKRNVNKASLKGELSENYNYCNPGTQYR
jgi:hypothetical protein